MEAIHLGKNRILVVEDDKAISDGITVNLLYSGYDYAVFDNGQTAADSLADDHSYDLALLDIMLPGIDGFELLTHMKQYNIPVIYLTAKDDTPSEIKGLRNGAEDYIIKPFEILTLLVRIEKVLKRTGKLNQILRVDDITIDLENHTVHKGGEEILLKPIGPGFQQHGRCRAGSYRPAGGYGAAANAVYRRLNPRVQNTHDLPAHPYRYPLNGQSYGKRGLCFPRPYPQPMPVAGAADAKNAVPYRSGARA